MTSLFEVARRLYLRATTYPEMSTRQRHEHEHTSHPCWCSRTRSPQMWSALTWAAGTGAVLITVLLVLALDLWVVLVVLAAWALISAVLALFLGRMIRLQDVHGAEPAEAEPTIAADGEVDLRQEIIATLAAAADITQATAAMMRVFARHHQPAVWTEPLVQDVVSRMTESLQGGGIPAWRPRVAEALAAAGIAPGEVR